MKGPRKVCACGRTHWSVDSERCPFCRNTDHAKEVAKFGKRSHRKAGERANSIVWDRRGRCRLQRACHVHWRHLDHQHCRCGRPMSVRAELCGACCALELMEVLLKLGEPPQPVEDYADAVDPYRMYLDDLQGIHTLDFAGPLS